MRSDRRHTNGGTLPGAGMHDATVMVSGAAFRTGRSRNAEVSGAATDEGWFRLTSRGGDVRQFSEVTGLSQQNPRLLIVSFFPDLIVGLSAERHPPVVGAQRGRT